MTGGALCRRAFDDLRGATAASRVLRGIDRIENGLFAIEIASVKPIADKHDPVLVTAGLANLKLQAKHRSIASRCGATAPVRLKALKGSARRLRTYCAQSEQMAGYRAKPPRGSNAEHERSASTQHMVSCFQNCI